MSRLPRCLIGAVALLLGGCELTSDGVAAQFLDASALQAQLFELELADELNPPEIDSLTTLQGAPGDVVAIVGNHFGDLNEDRLLTVDTVQVQPISWSGQLIVFRLPLLDDGSYTIEVDTGFGSATVDNFDLATPADLDLVTTCDLAGCVLECAVDDAPFTDCGEIAADAELAAAAPTTASNIVIEGLSAGEHRLHIRLSDAFGNTGTAVSYGWTFAQAFLATIAATIVEGGQFAVTADIEGLELPLEVEVDCDGDDLFDEFATIPPDSLPIHCDTPPSGEIEVVAVIVDAEERRVEAVTTVIIDNVVPTFVTAAATLSEGDTFVFDLNIAEPGDTLFVDLDCDNDGTLDGLDIAHQGDVQSVSCGAGSGRNQGSYVVTGVASDEELQIAYTFNLVVDNVAPTVSTFSNDGPANEATTGTLLTLTSTDPFDTPLTAEVDCDDDNVPDLVFDLTPGIPALAFCDLGGPLNQGSYPITARVRDDLTSVDVATSLVLHNVPPTADNVPTFLAGNEGDGNIGFSIDVNDTLAADPLVADVDCDGDGVLDTFDVPESTGSIPVNCAGVVNNQGQFTITGVVEDDADYGDQFAIPVTINNVAPTVVLFSVGGPFPEGQATFDSVLFATDPFDNPIHVLFDCDGDPLTPEESTFPMALTGGDPILCPTHDSNQGVYPVTGYIVDDAATPVTFFDTLVIENVAPELVALAISDFTEADLSFRVQIEVTEPVDALTLDLDCDGNGTLETAGLALTVGTSVDLFCHLGAQLNQGFISVTGVVRDDVNATTSFTRMVEVLNVAPGVASAAPVSIYNEAVTLITLSLAVNDPLDDPLDVDLDCDGDGTLDTFIAGGVFLPGGTVDCVVSPLDDGLHPITGMVIDDAGATATFATVVTVNNLPAQVLQTVVQGPVFEGDNSYSLYLAITDPYDTPVSIEVDCDGNGSLDLGGPVGFPLTDTVVACPLTPPLDNGTYGATGVIHDGTDLTLFGFDLTVVNVAPSITSAVQAATVFEGASTFEIDLQVGDIFDTTLEVSLDCDNDSVLEQTGILVPLGAATVTCTLSGPANDGNYPVTVVVADGDGGNDVTSLTVVILNVAPTAITVTNSTPIDEAVPFYSVFAELDDPFDSMITMHVDCDANGSLDTSGIFAVTNVPAELPCVVPGGFSAGAYPITGVLFDGDATTPITTTLLVLDIPDIDFEPTFLTIFTGTELNYQQMGYPWYGSHWGYGGPWGNYGYTYGFGSRVAVIPDIDGDGIDDLITSDPSAYGWGYGYAYNHDGGGYSYGWGATSKTAVARRGYLWTYAGDGPPDGSIFYAQGPRVRSDFGESLAVIGDVNGDGTADIAVGAPLERRGTDGPPYKSPGGPGTVYVLSGTNGTTLYYSRGDTTAVGSALGTEVAAAGDLDGDSVPDFLASDPQYASGGPSGGRVYAFSGTDGSKIFHFDDVGITNLGRAIISMGDVVGDDGVPDFLASGYAVSGATFGVKNGNEYGVAALINGATGTKFAMAGSAPANKFEFGQGVLVPGDLDNDGRNDAVIGDPGWGYGTLIIVSGADGSEISRIGNVPESGSLGIDLAEAPDLDRDGRSDLWAIDEDCNRYGTIACVLGLKLPEGDVITRIDAFSGASYGGAYATVADIAAGNFDTDDVRDIAIGSPTHNGPNFNLSVLNVRSVTREVIGTARTDASYAVSTPTGYESQYSLDGGPWQAKTALSEVTFSGLSQGVHELRLRAVTLSGVPGTFTTHTWEVDGLTPNIDTVTPTTLTQFGSAAAIAVSGTFSDTLTDGIGGILGFEVSVSDVEEAVWKMWDGKAFVPARGTPHYLFMPATSQTSWTLKGTDLPFLEDDCTYEMMIRAIDTSYNPSAPVWVTAGTGLGLMRCGAGGGQ